MVKSYHRLQAHLGFYLSVLLLAYLGASKFEMKSLKILDLQLNNHHVL